MSWLSIEELAGNASVSSVTVSSAFGKAPFGSRRDMPDRCCYVVLSMLLNESLIGAQTTMQRDGFVVLLAVSKMSGIKKVFLSCLGLFVPVTTAARTCSKL